jgi:hypothetical protein
MKDVKRTTPDRASPARRTSTTATPQRGEGQRARSVVSALQRSIGNRAVGQLVEQYAARNRTGLPDQVKTGVEQLSGMSLDDVRVHYNSSRPAEVQAHAYTQGSDIYVAPGREQHVAHEAWHVVQQARGGVPPTLQAAGLDINDDPALEHEADVMGAGAWNIPAPSMDELETL